MKKWYNGWFYWRWSSLRLRWWGDLIINSGDQWRKADPALQPPSTLSPFLHFERFFLTDQSVFKLYIHIYLRKICICICLSLYFLSVLTFASFFPSLDGLRPITPVLQDLITRESTEEEFFFTQSTTYRSDETK